MNAIARPRIQVEIGFGSALDGRLPHANGRPICAQISGAQSARETVADTNHECQSQPNHSYPESGDEISCKALEFRVEHAGTSNDLLIDRACAA
jgi:hypothetical protein